MKIIFDYNRTLFDPEKGDLYPNVLEILICLSKNHELFLVSKNEIGRESFLNELGISNFFVEKIFTKEKTPDLFMRLVDKSKNVLVVGDRIKGEIYIGNMLGYKTVWIKQGKFSQVLPEKNEELPNHTINEIIELLEIIKKYE